MNVSKEQLFIRSESIDWEDAAPGVRRKVTAFGDDLMSVYVEFKAGSIGALHHHPHRQITYIQSGSFRGHIGDKTEVLSGGDFYYIPRDIVHGVEALEDSVLVDMFTPAREDFIPKS